MKTMKNNFHQGQRSNKFKKKTHKVFTETVREDTEGRIPEDAT